MTLDNHTRFLTHLDQSVSAVWRVAKWLNDKGYSVKVNPTAKADAHKNWRNYADHGDIEISQRVEVKQLSVNFTNADDWPFPDFIVCAKHSYDNARPKPYGYIILSADGDHAAVVMGYQQGFWYSEHRKDNRYDNVEQEFYLCPLNLVKWYRIGG